MRSIRDGIKKAAFVFVAVLFLSQAIRIDRSNPPVRSDLTARPGIKSLLQRACYNCHSNETDWPWYSGLAPASWLVGNDVQEGRRHLNFSEWGTYDSGTQSHKLRGIAEEVKGGGMPPWYYSLVHPDSHLNPSERDQILAWTAEAVELEAK
jgi:Haem-binding domain